MNVLRRAMGYGPSECYRAAAVPGPCSRQLHGSRKPAGGKSDTRRAKAGRQLRDSHVAAARWSKASPAVAEPAMSVSVTTEGDAGVKVATDRKVPGSTVIITGGSQGVGRDLALLYARRSHNVVLVARQQDRLDSVADECRKLAGRPDAALAYSGDVGDAAAVQQLVEQVTHKYETVDLVINNAGVCATGALEDMPAEDIASLMSINFLGPAYVSRAFIPLLKAAAAKRPAGKAADPRPTLAMVGSFAARMPLKSMSVYSASKHAIAGLADALRYELEPAGVNVVQVHPGIVASSFLSRAGFYGQLGEKAQKGTEKLIESGQAQKPEQIAQAVASAIDKGQHEVVVGAPFKALVAGYRLTGINPSAWGV